MFRKILIANRGEIAVRIARTCREMGIATVALYEAIDETSLHIRLADESVLLQSPRGFHDQDAILKIACAKGADAIHPGYGFLAENVEFAHACHDAQIAFIAPPLNVLERVLEKIETLKAARAAGFATVEHSLPCAEAPSLAQMRAQAELLGYPLVIKSCRGGRGRAAQLVREEKFFEHALVRAQREAQNVYGAPTVFMEKVITPAHQVGIQFLADNFGSVVHLGEREGSLLYGGQKMFEETPAPCMNDAQREKLFQTALEMVRLFELRGLFTLEFLVDARGIFHFVEIKPRIQIEHALTEMRARLDLVREQIRLAAGEPLGMTQADVTLCGCALSCRIHAQDPQKNFMPSPGRVRVRFSHGPETRTDTYIYSGCLVPTEYDPLIAKVTVWDHDRPRAMARLQRALREITFHGIATNVGWLERALAQPDVQRGVYSTETEVEKTPIEDTRLRDLAIAAALLYAGANGAARPVVPERLLSNWHRAARKIPE